MSTGLRNVGIMPSLPASQNGFGRAASIITELLGVFYGPAAAVSLFVCWWFYWNSEGWNYTIAGCSVKTAWGERRGSSLTESCWVFFMGPRLRLACLFVGGSTGILRVGIIPLPAAQ